MIGSIADDVILFYIKQLYYGVIFYRLAGHCLFGACHDFPFNITLRWFTTLILRTHQRWPYHSTVAHTLLGPLFVDRHWLKLEVGDGACDGFNRVWATVERYGHRLVSSQYQCCKASKRNIKLKVVACTKQTMTRQTIKYDIIIALFNLITRPDQSCHSWAGWSIIRYNYYDCII